MFPIQDWLFIVSAGWMGPMQFYVYSLFHAESAIMLFKVLRICAHTYIFSPIDIHMSLNLNSLQNVVGK